MSPARSDIEVIRTQEGLRALEPSWERLWSQDPAADIFVSFDWFANWWTHFGHGVGPAALVVHGPDGLIPVPGRGARLRVLVIRHSGEVVAIFPLVLLRGRWRGWPARILASPVSAHAPRSGFLPSNLPRDVIAAMADHLARNGRWDVLLLESVRKPSAVSPVFRELADRMGFVGFSSTPWTHSNLPLDGTWDEYLARQSGHFRKHLRQTRRALEELGSVTAKRYATPEEIDLGMRTFVAIDLESWKAQRGECIGRHRELTSYYQDLASRFGKKGRCEIWILSIGGEPVAAFLCLTDGRAVYTIKTSYKKEFGSARYGPSIVLLSHIIQAAYEDGRTSVDFVGRMPFVERWTSEGQEFERLVVYRQPLYERVVRLLDQAEAFSDKVRDRLHRLGRWPGVTHVSW